MFPDTSKNSSNSSAPHFFNHQVLLAMAALVLAILAVLIGLLVVNNRTSAVILTQKKQLSSLIDEVGRLQDDNYRLYVTKNQSKQEMDYMAGLLRRLTTEYDRWQAEQKELVSTRQELTATKNSLNNLKIKSQTNSKKTFIAQNGLASLATPLKTASDDGLLTFLILGTHGTLTDTIILAVVNPAKKTVSLISVPRDFYVNGRKINELYQAYGIAKTAQMIGEITGFLPDNYVVIDLPVFVTIIDVLGGIDVMVERGIYDPLYPGPKATYTTFSIAKGEQHLDGQTALKYARSRETTSDFDRSRRQQQLISSVWQKLKQINFLRDFSKALELYNTIRDSLVTDVEIFKGLGYVQDYSAYTLETNNVLSTANYLYSTKNEWGQYILLPKTGDFDEIKEFVRKIVEE